MRLRNLLLSSTSPNRDVRALGFNDLTIEAEGGEAAGGGTLMNAPPADAAPAEPPAPAGDTLMDAPPADAAPAEPADGDKPADAGDKDDAEPEGAPEAYADFTAPEGVELDADTLASFKDAAKELNLPQAKAQQLVDMAAGLVQKQAEASNAAGEQFIAKIREENAGVFALPDVAEAWRTASTTDPEFGGAKLTESLRIASAARDQFASPTLRELLTKSKLGDNPEMIRLFVKVGQAISEDSTVLPGKPAGQVSFYDHPTSKKKSA